MIKLTILLCSVSALAIAYPNAGTAFGSTNDTAFVNANINPNTTKVVPFRIGDQNFTFSVNVAEFTPEVSTVIVDPRVAASFYAIEWSGGSGLGDIVGEAESVASNQSPRLCVSLPLGLLSASVNNDYKEENNGDCSGALGKDCVNDLMSMSYELNSACTGSLPQSCMSKLDTGGIGSARLTYLIVNRVTTAILSQVSSQNSSSQMSPLDFSYWSSPIYAAGNDTYYQREVERLHVVIFAGTQNVPVCLRVKTDHVSDKSPATSGAARNSRIGLTSAVMVALGCFFMLA
ncbi:hypothetical protein E4T38_00303 [Aureobasidium subglaciale]|nr:hypothetical protein E4T38_00303 [Aureobasidium subglaciale]KAI5232369.1 hypothetical protein E4T40_00302 [Aureobasidium subglaciale]KAI5234692.1 hypothetical protein E4T41_00302 [Aureobasidium subglaciale]KAI5268341.1 hypothetical protein E4T46_00302 [Aureobasidium subglaciale]